MQVLRESQYIKHARYGFGTVIQSDANRTTVDFELHGPKKFVTSMWEAELAGEAPPKPSRPKRRKKQQPAALAPPEAATPHD